MGKTCTGMPSAAWWNVGRPVLMTLAVLAVAATAIALPAARGSVPMVKVAKAGALAELYAARGYPAGAGAVGSAAGAAVPRLLLAALPADLDATRPAERKLLFQRVMLPLVLTANEEIAADRAQLQAIADQVEAGMPLTGEQSYWLAAVARRYGIELDAALARPDGLAAELPALLPELLRRVDVVPPSLAVAQAAIESGWGTSRFAREGNALFGERSWSADGLEPLARASGATHRVRSFPRLIDAVDAYMVNLNTHPAYAGFRQARAALRTDDAAPGGIALVPHLARYSERGAAYARAVTQLIRANGLEALDRLPDPVSGRVGEPTSGLRRSTSGLRPGPNRCTADSGAN